MALKTLKQTIEAEELVCSAQGQALIRAEALVPGAGREAVEALLAEASLTLEDADVQPDRLVLGGTARCQAVYRQGDEATLRALTAQAGLSHVLEAPGAQAGMTARVTGRVEHVDARYENGHMVFLITVGLRAQVLHLTPVEVIAAVEGVDGLETEYAQMDSVKLAAEATAEALLREQVPLPAALDARVALMEWGAASVESAEADLGGVRVKGRINAEALVSSGVTGRPVALIKYPMPFDQLVELPEWLSKDAAPEVCIKNLGTRVDQGEDGEDAVLTLEAEVVFRLRALVRDGASALTDAYTTHGSALALKRQTVSACSEIQRTSFTDVAKGAVLLSENAPGVGTVLAVRALPNLGGWRAEGGGSLIEGLVELNVLYMPGGSDRLASARAELPFSVNCPGELGENSWVHVEAVSAEANALLSDRLEIRVNLAVEAETRVVTPYAPVTEVSEAETVARRPGIVLFWPGQGDSVWSIGKRYNLPVEKVVEMNGGQRYVEPGKAMMLRI